MRDPMPERFVMPSLNDVAKTVGDSIKESQVWKVRSSERSNTNRETRRIASQ